MSNRSPSMELILLGTGGGRFVSITQKRRTGGIRILTEKANIHLDPGPGALVYSLAEGLNPQKINCLLVSHCHQDHSNDAEILIEAMTGGMTKKRGMLVAAPSALAGNQHCEASISKYHQAMVAQVLDARPGTSFNIYGVNASATEASHTDPDTVGFRFETSFGDIAYTSDSEYFDGIGKRFVGVRLLILCVLRPAGSPWKGHMTSTDAVEIIAETKPEMAVLTHMGMQMIFKGPASEAKLIQQKTGIRTVAASDGMRIIVGEEISLRSQRRQKALKEFTEP